MKRLVTSICDRVNAYGICVSRLVLLLAMLAPTSHAQRGWVNEVLPEGMVRSPNRGEYTWTKTGETMVFVPSGPSTDYILGVANGTSTMTLQNVNVEGFYIGKFELTVAAYRRFVQATNYKTEAERLGKVTVWDPKTAKNVEKSGVNWLSPGFPQTDQHPVVFVTWEDAKAYCDWAGERLPSRLEWLKAELWDDGTQRARGYPWGFVPPPLPKPGEPFQPNQPDPNAKMGNFMDVSFFKENGLAVPAGLLDDGYAFTAPVGSFPEGASYYGALDMAGNVSEWTGDQVAPWMQDAFFAQFKQPLPPGYFAIGTSWGSSVSWPVVWPLSYPNPGGWPNIGFRIVVPAPLRPIAVKK